MGHKDLDSIHRIYDEIIRLNEQYNWDFNFKCDNGYYETRVDISEQGISIVGNGRLPLPGFEMFCPDLLDYKNGIIIEFEEESKPNSRNGAKLHKGHNPELLNKRDAIRDRYYEYGKFKVLKIWESDKSWKENLKKFLIDCFMSK